MRKIKSLQGKLGKATGGRSCLRIRANGRCEQPLEFVRVGALGDEKLADIQKRKKVAELISSLQEERMDILGCLNHHGSSRKGKVIK